MKIICLGDTHGTQWWKYIINTQKFDLLIFIGDYLDSFNISGEDQGKNLLDIIEFKKNNSHKVVLLLGNHDVHYWPGIGDTNTSGYQAGMASTFEWIFESNKELFRMAYKHENILFTHAGFAPTWIETLVKFAKVRKEMVEWVIDNVDQIINDLWKYKPYSFLFRDYNGRADPYGDDPYQSPIWIRPKSLMKDCQEIKKDIIQVVGHTSMSCIDIKGKSTGGRYYFIDTLPTSGEYLIIENEELKLGKI